MWAKGVRPTWAKIGQEVSGKTHVGQIWAKRGSSPCGSFYGRRWDRVQSPCLFLGTVFLAGFFMAGNSLAGNSTLREKNTNQSYSIVFFPRARTLIGCAPPLLHVIARKTYFAGKKNTKYFVFFFPQRAASDLIKIAII